MFIRIFRLIVKPTNYPENQLTYLAMSTAILGHIVPHWQLLQFTREKDLCQDMKKKKEKKGHI